LECSLGMSRLEGARKCGRRLRMWVNGWTVRGWAGRLACHGGFQFENSVKEHTKKRNEANVIWKEQNRIHTPFQNSNGYFARPSV
jgi:hypothetical protein